MRCRLPWLDSRSRTKARGSKWGWRLCSPSELGKLSLAIDTAPRNRPDDLPLPLCSPAACHAYTQPSPFPPLGKQWARKTSQPMQREYAQRFGLNTKLALSSGFLLFLVASGVVLRMFRNCRDTSSLTHPPRGSIIQGLLVLVLLRARRDVVLPPTSAAQLYPNPAPVSFLSASLAYGSAEYPPSPTPVPWAMGFTLCDTPTA